MKLKHALMAAMLLASPSFAGVERSGDATAAFTGKGPAGFKLEGKTNEVVVKDQGDKVVFSVPLATLKTGIDLRDRHMQEKYLEVAKYPEAVLEVLWTAIKLPENGQTVTQTTNGKMTIHGKTKEVPVTYTVKRNGDVYEASGKVPLNLKDYDINIPNYMGVTVKPDIETAVSFSFKKT
ncbi:YceI family protein [Archangium violaceum]|uniref:YceI family protein n=1 Tax=Archangium violaceum TaxID=83451 RepID=UPI00193B88FB|nr:YceI family protein [Archangium violaceum]QRK07398.1 YceI family protein [Archangium violaceum]